MGGGASGTLTAVHLLHRAHARGASLHVALVDRFGRHGTGQAYATCDPRHLLNVPLARMSALADDPGHLLRWSRGLRLDPEPSDFLPRGLYGRYLREVLADAARRGGPALRVTQVTSTVASITRPGLGRPLRTHLANGGRIDADAVVLATGNRAPTALPQVTPGRRYVPDPWAPGALTAIRDGAPVLMVGMGLTMADVAITVTNAHPDTVVYALSRHGLLPRPHPPIPAAPAPVALPTGPLTLAELLRAVRVAVHDNDGEWHGVIDALRPCVPLLWERLSVEDRRRFLCLVARYWEIHRHRLPPATASRLTELRAAGRLRLIRGRLLSATTDRDGVTARIGGDVSTELRAGWLINATGPCQDVMQDPFLAGLFECGLARPDPLRLGVDAAPDGAVLDASRRPHERIFTLGPPLRGLRYETTAIPEIRAQAAALADRLIPVLAPNGPPSAAVSARTLPRQVRPGADETSPRTDTRPLTSHDAGPRPR